MKEYVVGIDIGTSSCKTIVVDSEGSVLASASDDYPLNSPGPGWAEQDPEDWWRAVVRTLRAVLVRRPDCAGSLAGIGLSGQMHGLVALDSSLSVIRPAILWNDQRTMEECRLILEAAGGLDGLLGLTNNTMLPGYTAGKILWLRGHEPHNYEKACIFLNPKDYIRLKLTGELATEVSDASGTGLFDVRNRVWSDALIRRLGLSIALFPPCLESPETSGRITGKAAEETGLPEGTPVVGGGGDAVIQTTGTGLVREGILGLTIGTAGIVSMGLQSFKANTGGRLQVFCANAPGTWNVMGVTLSAGGSLKWFRDALAREGTGEGQDALTDAFDRISRTIAEGSVPGSRKLLFLPYLSGERCPHADPDARGAFIGLTLGHSYADLARSVLEGVVYSLRDVFETFGRANEGMEVREIRISGGGSSSALWRQIAADVFQLPVYTVSGSKEGGAYGAALVAGTGCGLWGSLREAVAVVKPVTENLPDIGKRTMYEDIYGVYTGLYSALRGPLERLAACALTQVPDGR